MKITDYRPYNGGEQRIERLGITPLLNELKEIIQGCEVRLLAEKNKID